MLKEYLNIKHDYASNMNCLILICMFYEKELGIMWDEERKLFNNFEFKSLREVRKQVTIEKLHGLKNWIKIDLITLQNYDILVHAKSNKISHFSMYVGEQKVLDLRENQYSMLRHLDDKQRENIEGCYRHRQLVASIPELTL